MTKEKQIEWINLEPINLNNLNYKGKVKVKEKIFKNIKKLAGRLELSVLLSGNIDEIMESGIHIICDSDKTEIFLINHSVIIKSGMNLLVYKDPESIIKSYLIKMTVDNK